MYPVLTIRTPVEITAIHSFFCHQFPSDYSFPGEVHDFWEMIVVLQGKLCVTAAERVCTLSKGETMVYRPMEFHSFFVDDPQGAQVFVFSFTAEVFSEQILSGRVFRLTPFQLELAEALLNYLKRRNLPEPTGEYGWFQIYMQLFREDTEALLMTSSFLTQLLYPLFGCKGQWNEICAEDAGLFRKAADFLEAHLHESVSVEELAKAVNISSAGLNRLFRKYAGVSVHKYFLMQKIRAASHALRNGVGVTQTARQFGFSGQSYFSACFKRETGQNPSELMKR